VQYKRPATPSIKGNKNLHSLHLLKKMQHGFISPLENNAPFVSFHFPFNRVDFTKFPAKPEISLGRSVPSA
jgi:hypothetical protein